MKRQVLYQELFQLSEKIKQLDYKIDVQKDETSKLHLMERKKKLEMTRSEIKSFLSMIYGTITRPQNLATI